MDEELFLQMDEEVEILEDSEISEIFNQNYLEQYMNSLKKYPILSGEEINKLYVDVLNGDKKARDKIVYSNLRLVVSVANKYKALVKNMTFFDLIQVGNLALLNAIDRYDPSRASFTTFAYQLVTQAIVKEVNEYDDQIRKPWRVNKLVSEYSKIVNEYYDKHKENPSDEYIAQRLGIPVNKMDDVKKVIVAANAKIVSINSKVGDDEETELEELIGDDDLSFQDVTNKMDNVGFLYNVKNLLTPVEYYVIYNYVINAEAKTLTSLQSSLHIGRERLSQIHLSAMKKLEKNIGKIRKINDVDYDYNVDPITPMDVLKYLYIKDSLSEEELRVYYEKVFGKYKLTDCKIINHLNMSLDEYNHIMKKILKKMKVVFKDSKKFKEFVDKMLNKHKTNIYKLCKYEPEVHEEVDFNKIDQYFNGLSFSDFMNKYSYLIKPGDMSTINLLKKYFMYGKQPTINAPYLENKINLLNSGVTLKNDSVPLDELYKVFNTHLSEYTKSQQLYILKNVFNKNVGVRITQLNKDELLLKLEKHYFKIFDLNGYDNVKRIVDIPKFDKCDILANMRYFTFKERELINLRYIDGVGVAALAMKYNVEVKEMQNRLDLINSKLYNLIIDHDARKFDFEFYENNKDNVDVPFYGDKKLAKKIFDLYFGYNGNECLTIPEIIGKLNLDKNIAEVKNILDSYLVGMCKFQKGYVRKHPYTYDSVQVCFEQIKSNLSVQRRKEYIEYLDSKNKIGNHSISSMPNEILLDLEKYKLGKKYFRLGTCTKKEILEILDKYNDYLSDKIKQDLCMMIDVDYKNYMNGRERNHVYRFLNRVYKLTNSKNAVLKKV